jgi:hypothetical protein
MEAHPGSSNSDPQGSGEHPPKRHKVRQPKSKTSVATETFDAPVTVTSARCPVPPCRNKRSITAHIGIIRGSYRKESMLYKSLVDDPQWWSEWPAKLIPDSMSAETVCLLAETREDSDE